MKAREGFLPWAELEGRLREFEAASAAGDASAVLALRDRLVGGFQRAGLMADARVAEDGAAPPAAAARPSLR